MKRTIVVTWGESITRSHSLCVRLGFEDFHIKPKYSGYLGKLFNYFRATYLQFMKLTFGHYERVIVVSPPVFTIYIAYLSRFFTQSKFEIVIDCHNGVLRREWAFWPLLKLLMRRSDIVLSHNNIVKSSIDDFFGVCSEVLTDPLMEDFPLNVDVSKFIKKSKCNILVPVSYADDEPIDNIISAAKTLGGRVNLILTGNYRKKFDDISNLPVTFTGFVTSEEYYSLMRTVDSVLCLTLNDNIQMCALIESISLRKNIIASNNSVNRSLFSDFVFNLTENDDESIAFAINHLLVDNNGSKLDLDIGNGYDLKWLEVADEIFK